MRGKRREGKKRKERDRSKMKKNSGNGGICESIDDEIKRKKNKGKKEGSSI